MEVPRSLVYTPLWHSDYLENHENRSSNVEDCSGHDLIRENIVCNCCRHFLGTLLRLRDNIIGTPLPPPKEKIKKKGLKYHREIDRVIHYYPSRKFYIAFAVESGAFLQSVTTSFAGRREIQYCPSCLSDVRTPQWPKH